MSDFVFDENGDEVVLKKRTQAELEAGIAELADILGYTRRGVFFGGAGVSTESGIPDFRSQASEELAEELFGLPPEILLSIEFARKDPVTFHRYIREHIIDTAAKPNAAHLALAKLEADGRLAAVVTQNIDGLHQLAGSQNVYELHGSLQRNYCEGCAAKYSLDWVLDPANCREPDQVVPVCPKCGGWVRPDIVLYGEALPENAMLGAVAAINDADTLIVGGTSLVVYPAANFLHYFKGHTRVLINLGPTGYDSHADLVISAPIGEVLGEVIDQVPPRNTSET
ncbi:MAG: NAD-dependent protein deacylase [Cellulomonadaceae bacterium]|nr:NAD-dependent protein deacylase [Cellulomonadaceae bacterium]